MGFLYILSEGERDDLFYELLAARVTGCGFERPADFRLRHGANWKTAIAAGRLLLNRVRHWTEPQEVAVILAVDNDRAPGHPGSAPPPRPLVGHDRNKQARYPAVRRMIADALGEDRHAWPVDVAVAMPVEMIESWVLCLSNPARPTLPLFAEVTQPSACVFYGKAPPPQLKDLCKSEAAESGCSLDDYFWRAAGQELALAVVAASSLRMFVEEMQNWRCAQSA